MSVPHEPDYSTLEVDYSGRCVEKDLEAAPQVLPGEDTDKEPIVNPVRWSQPVESSPQPATICGLRRRIFWTVLAVALLVIGAAATVGAKLGGRSAHKDNNSSSSNSSNSNNSNSSSNNNTSPSLGQKTSPLFQNSRLSALQWVDDDAVRHYRVYFQTQSGVIQESAWDSDGPNQWVVSNTTSAYVDVKLGTPIAAVTGQLFMDQPGVPVTCIYYLDKTNQICERQATANGSENWATIVGFSGRYLAAEDSNLAVLWEQDFNDGSEAISYLWQEDDPVGTFSMGTYVSNETATHQSDPTQIDYNITADSTFTLVSSGVQSNPFGYLSGSDGSLKQFGYTTVNITTTSVVDLDASVPPGTPFTVVTQDNRVLFDKDTLPDCFSSHPLTHLILYATPDRTSLNLMSWNCSHAAYSTSSYIQPLLKPNRTYIALASHSDSRAYVMFDEGNGPEIEEWTAPATADVTAWSGVRRVAVGNGK